MKIIEREDGCFEFVDKYGNVLATAMNRTAMESIAADSLYISLLESTTPERLSKNSKEK